MNNQNFSEVYGKALNNVLLVYRFFHSSYLLLFIYFRLNSTITSNFFAYNKVKNTV